VFCGSSLGVAEVTHLCRQQKDVDEKHTGGKGKEIPDFCGLEMIPWCVFV